MIHFVPPELLIWRQKWTAGVRHDTSLVVRLVSSGRPIVVLFWTKYALPRQIKPGILNLTTNRGPSNLLTVFSFVNCEEKGYYRVVSVGQLSFDYRSYCGRSCRMQGGLTRCRISAVKSGAVSGNFNYGWGEIAFLRRS